MSTLKIAVFPGDGIGQEVMHSALPILDALNIPVELTLGEIGWECWKNEGETVPQKSWDLIQSSDVTLLGAITSQPEREALAALPEHLKQTPPPYLSPVVQLRQKLDLFANIRPCYAMKGAAENFNFCIIRENTEGLYAGFDFHPIPEALKNIFQDSKYGKLNPDQISCSLRVQTESGLKRLFEYGFEYADKHQFHRVTFADKPNVLRKSSAFAREIFESVAAKYPHIQKDILNVDAVALWLVRRPHEFGVIIAENMFGDILSDLGAGVMGGLGFAPSANIGAKGAYFEPVHGSAPNIKSGRANPSAMFLTIGLMLEHMGYFEESTRIKKGIQQVLRMGKSLTYDLGGDATTNQMANEIIKTVKSKKSTKTISFLATGNEIIEGDIQNTNSQSFAKILNQSGAHIYQHVAVSDKKTEIAQALRYLLANSDAVVVTGGLGPTSDDNTRFAVSEVTRKNLIFDDASWQAIEKRFQQFNIPLSLSNKQQALFPQDAVIYENPNGSARGCYLKWQDKYIFMLPGPPKECVPMFHEQVIPMLQKDSFFEKSSHYRWVTLGLIESDISEKVEILVKDSGFETGYLWSYPYLEVKIKSADILNSNNTVSKIDALLSGHIVSKDGKNAFEILQNTLSEFPETIYIDNQMEWPQDEILFEHPSLNDNNENQRYHFSISASKSISNHQENVGTITFSCEGFSDNHKIYQHELSVPYRGSDIIKHAKAYAAWQLHQFIKTTEGKQ